jgi:hypothetical protein
MSVKIVEVQAKCIVQAATMIPVASPAVQSSHPARLMKRRFSMRSARPFPFGQLVERLCRHGPRVLNPVAALWLFEVRSTDYVLKDPAVLLDCSDRADVVVIAGH